MTSVAPAQQASEHSPTLLGGISFPNPVIRRALVLSLWDGILSSGMAALAETFAIAAAVSLHAQSFAIGILGSLPLFLSSIGQLVLPAIINPLRGRKFYVVRGAAVQSLFLGLCALSGFLPRAWGASVFIAAFVMYGFSGSTVNALWMGWIRGLVPANVRGRHFAWRNRRFGVVSLACSLSVGLLARKYTAATAPWAFYLLVFMSACAFRAVSARVLSRQYEEPVVLERTPLFSGGLSRKFITYVVANALLQGTTSLAGPFFNVWFVRDLHFDYLNLALLSAFSILANFLFFPFWGKLNDRIGNFRLLQASAWMIALVPLPYLFFQAPWQLWFFQFYSGLAWSAFGLSNFNYLLEASGEEQPDRHISIAVAATGVSCFVFGMLGGYLANRLPIFFGFQLRSLFLASSLLRIAVVVLLMRLLSRHEGVNPLTPMELFGHLAAYRPSLSLLRNVFRAFRSQ